VKLKVDKLDNTYTYISRPNSWYKEGASIQLEYNCGSIGGLFRGPIIIDNDHGPFFIKKYGLGAEAMDGELCTWDEFDIYDSVGNQIEIED